MTSSTIHNLPLNIIGAILSLLKRSLIALATIIIKAPLASAIIVAMGFGSLFALVNALYFQPSPHLSPLFSAQQMTNQTLVPHVQTPLKEVSTIAPVQPVIAPISAPLKAPKPAMPSNLAKIKHQDVVDLQQKLYSLGFYNGKIDGFYGEQTADAIRKFQASIGQKPVGAITPELLNQVKHIKNTSPAANIAPLPAMPKPVMPNVIFNPANAAAAATSPKSSDDPLLQIAGNVAQNIKANPTQTDANKAELIRKVQLGLASLGFLQGKIDGVAGEATAKAIRNFEVYYNYKVTGVVSIELVDLLIEAGAKI